VGAALSWAGLEWLLKGKPSVLGAASGMVAGLATITPASGFVTIPAAFFIGLCGGAVCYLAVTKLKSTFGYDDSLDVFGVHGVGSTVGLLLVGLFANPAVNGLIATTFKSGDAVISLAGSLAQIEESGHRHPVHRGFQRHRHLSHPETRQRHHRIARQPEEEHSGLDLTQHGESAYND
jgi:Amt family ammonium transporter